ncbi:hypothetical protein CSKR_100235 [Clonorchis sinensis]|uniref:Uncharacterized protein n=1 Tax=Clonorchis sinensis TaxID=79923 RepID=A0A419PE88_CLOSI|nr:hypothetical protein CSKR_100235 [Clonorchis sinensis]
MHILNVPEFEFRTFDPRRRRQLPARLSLLVSAFVLRCQVTHCPPLGSFHPAQGWPKRALRGRLSSGMRSTCPSQRSL